jgi:hypothetical protein
MVFKSQSLIADIFSQNILIYLIKIIFDDFQNIVFNSIELR